MGVDGPTGGLTSFAAFMWPTSFVNPSWITALSAS
jgi:hypothetical protein